MHIFTMVVLWLCSVAHPRQRMTVDGHAHHLRLERNSAWFNGLLQDSGVLCSWTTTHVLHVDKFKLQGVLQIDEKDVQSWNGSLTSWSREGMLLHDYYHNPLDSFIVRAQTVFKLDDARPVYTKRDNRMRESQLSGADGIFQPSGLDFNVLSSCLGCERHVHDAFGRAPRRATLSEVVQCWGVQPDGFDGIAACLLPEPISELVLQGRWQDLLWMGRWGWFKSPLCQRGMWEGFVVPPAVQSATGQHEVLRSEPLNLLEVEGFLNSLRRWSPIVLSHCNSAEEQAGEQLQLEAFATWLRQLLLYFRPYFATELSDLQAKQRPDLCSHQRYSHSQLLGMVLFAWHLRDSAALTDVMPSALQAIMPDFFALTSVAKGVQVLKQSKSLLRNAQLGVDIALMLVRRRQLQASGPSARYGWADSSAVAKSDWLISKHQTVPESRCPDLWQSWADLVHSTTADNDNEQEALDAAVASRRKALTQELMAGVRVHTQPPQALALGLTALESKLAALLYSFFLEVGSMKGLKMFLSTFVSFTTDMGTEMGTASFILDDLQKLLPEWLAEPLLNPDVDEGGEDENSGAFEGLSLFMPRAIIIPGALHICSNLCKDVSGKLSRWDLFLKELALFEALLCNRDRRERFLATCVPADSDDRRLFKDFSGSLYEKRWGAVISFLRKLVPLLVAFEKHWNHDKYLHAYQQRDGANADEGVRFVAADLSAALGSSMFHAYIQMVMSLFNVVEDLSSWFEGCACHQAQLKRHRGKHMRSSRKEIELCGPYAFCPMKGKRAPELAAGCLNDVFSKLVNLGKTSLLKVIQDRKLEGQDEALVMQDFEAGRSYLQLGLQVKMNFWCKLPWRLAVLSHTDAAVARAAAADMLETTAGLAGFEGDASLVHHPMTLHFLGSGSLLRPMIQEFASGETMHEFLRSEACKLAFMPVVERSIEAKHSLISRRVQKNWRSGRIVSLTLRVPDIKAEMAADATYLQTLVEAFAQTRDPMQAARQLGIQEHPDLVNAVFDRWHHARVTGIVNRIVYRCDLQSKFESHAAARAGHDRETGKRARLAQREMQRIVQAPQAPPAKPRTPEERYTSMLRLAIEDHFTHVASACSQPCVYSLDLSSDPTGGAPALAALDAAFEGQGVAGVARATDGPRLMSDVEDVAEEPKLYFQDAEIVHFQVVHASPGNMHTVPMPRAAGTRLTKGQYAVSIHSLVEDGDGFRHIALEPVRQGQTSVAILSGLAAGKLDVLQETFTQFSMGPLSYNIKGFKAQGCSCSAEVSQLVRCSAFPASDGRCKVPFEDGRVPRQWEELEAAGFIESVSEDEDNMKAYVFTEAGAAGIQAVVTLVEPKLVCQPRSDIALCDLSVYELMKKLEDSGWSWSCLPSKTQQKKELCYSADRDKTYFFGNGLPSPLYLQCLLRAEELHDLGVLSIPHYSPTPSTTYRRLLQGEAIVTAPLRPPVRRALLQDVDEAGDSLEPLELQPPSDLVLGDGQNADTSPDVPRNATMEEIEEALGWFDSSEESVEDHRRTPTPPPAVESVPAVAGSDDVALAHEAEPADPASAHAETSEASEGLRVVQPGSVSRWGCFRISRLVPKPPFRKYGALEAVCPFHMRNEKSECKKYIGHKTDNPEDHDLDYKALLHWCNQACAFNRQKHHVGSHLLSHESARGLSMDVLIAHRINNPPSEPPIPDSVLDAPAPKAKATPRGKVKASMEPPPVPEVVVRRARKKQKPVQAASALPSEPAASTASVSVEAAPATAGSSSTSSSYSGSGSAASQASGSESDSSSSSSSSSS